MGRSTPDVYSPSPGDKLIPGAVAIDQFGALSSGGTLLSHGWDALCGWASAEITYAWAFGVAPTRDHIAQVFKSALAAGLTVGPGASQGVSTPATVSKELSDEGIPNYVTHDWENALAQYAGERPIEIMTQSPDHNLGRELPGDEYNVTGHFYNVEGWSESHQAFIVSDPDNSAAKSGQLVYYTLADMQAGGAQEAIVPDMANGAIGGGGQAVATSQSGQNPVGTIFGNTQLGQALTSLGLGAQGTASNAAQDTASGIGGGITAAVDTLFAQIGGASFMQRLLVGAAGVALAGIGLLVIVGSTEDKVGTAVGADVLNNPAVKAAVGDVTGAAAPEAKAATNGLKQSAEAKGGAA